MRPPEGRQPSQGTGDGLKSTLHYTPFASLATHRKSGGAVYVRVWSKGHCSAHSKQKATWSFQPRVRAVELVVLTLALTRGQDMSWPLARASSNICRSWNANCCKFPKCRYRHACSTCGDPHPVVAYAVDFTL